VTRARKKPTKKQIAEEVRQRWDGRSVAQIAEELQIHRATAYRVIGVMLRKP
jgi:DNA-binding IclR family transcriptional regulator